MTQKQLFLGRKQSLQTGNTSRLKKKALFLFSLTILLTLIVIVIILYESTSPQMFIQSFENGSESLIHQRTGNDNALGTANKYVVYLPVLLTCSLLLLFCTLIVSMILFLRNVITPLEDIGTGVQRMSTGKLDQLIRVKARGEICQIGECINDLSINMQEVLLYIWNHSQQSITLLDRVEKQLDNSPESVAHQPELNTYFKQVRRDNEELKSIVRSFRYFEVKQEHEKMVSDRLHDNAAPQS